MSAKSLSLIALVLVAATVALGARADSFNFTITGEVTGSGTITTAPLDGGEYLITAITGTIVWTSWDSPPTTISYLNPPGTCFSTGDLCSEGLAPGEESDNLFTASAPYFSPKGVNFYSTAPWTYGGIQWRFDSIGVSFILPGDFGYSAYWSGPYKNVSIDVSGPNDNKDVSEPSGLLLFTSGLVSLAGMIRRKQRA